MAEIHHYIDLPSDWERLPQCFLIRGWCYIPHHAPVCGIRLLSQNSCIDGEIGKLRPDVKLALPGAPDNFTGFEIKGVLSSGRQQLSIEVQLADKSWHLMLSRTVNVRRRWRPLWLAFCWSCQRLTGCSCGCQNCGPMSSSSHFCRW